MGGSEVKKRRWVQMRFNAKVQVWLREGIADPEGHTISEAISALGFSGISNVRMGKIISLELDADTQASAEQKVDQIATSLLSNPVLEDVKIEIVKA